MYIIDRNIPAPRWSHYSAHPLADLAIGESFFVASATERKRLQGLTSYYKKAHGKQFTIRKLDGGFRVWRVA